MVIMTNLKSPKIYAVLVSTCILFSTSLLSSVNAAPQKKIQNNQPIRLNQLIKIAIANNPGLKSKKLAWQSLIQQYPQATALSDPKLVYSESVNPIETRLGPQDRFVALSQKFPYPGKRALKGEVVKQDIKIAKVRYDKASRDLVVSLKQSFYELIYLENALKLSLQNKVVMEKITHIATTDYAASSSTLNDIAKAQSQYAQVSYDIQLLDELRSTTKTKINTLLNRPPEQPLQINSRTTTPPKFAHPVTRLYQWAEANEELKIADISIQKSELKKKLSRYSSLPDFDLGLRYTQIGESDIAGLPRSGEDGLAVSVGINIPLNRDKNKANKHQAYLDRQKSIEDKKTLANNLKNNVKSVYFKINNAQRLVTLYGKNLVPQANRAMQIAEVQYRENKGSIARYLETQSTWLNFQLAYQRAIADYWKNIAEMEKLTGRTL